MLGQHPQMYALPELHLFSAETLAEWSHLCSRESYQMDHGLVRTVAELYFGTQSEYTVTRARGWLRRRGHFNTSLVLEMLAERVCPLVVVEKSPSIVYRLESLKRAFAMFPDARFIHLLRHPRTYGESVMQALHDLDRAQPLPQSHWLRHLAAYPQSIAIEASDDVGLDPQWGWYSLNMRILEFLRSVPQNQQRTVRGEDLLADLNGRIVETLAWLGLRTDPEAVDEMKHPERSPYSCQGPASAQFGSDLFLFPGPILRPDWVGCPSLEGPLSWREDGQGFSSEVKQLATQFGYQ